MYRVFSRAVRRNREVVDIAALFIYAAITLWTAFHFAQTPNAPFVPCMLVVLTGSFLSMKAGRKVLFGY